jgi:hypothetical protein
MRFHLLILIPIFACIAGLPLRGADEKKPPEMSPPSEIGGKSLKQWIAEIKESDPSVIENAIRTLIHFGSAGRDAGPALIERLDHKDSSIRVNACIVLGLLNSALHKEDLNKAVDKISTKMNEDPQSIVRFHAALALSHFGTDAKPAIPKLIAATKDGYSWEIRKAAVIALTAAAAEKDREKGPDPRAVAALREALLSDTCAQVRLESAIGIGILGKPAQKFEAESVLKALEAKFIDNNKPQDKPVAIWAYAAYMALDGINSKKLASIAKYLKAPELAARCHAAKALSMFGSEAETHLPELIDLLHDKQPSAVASAAEAIAHLEFDFKEKDSKPIPKITARIKKEALPVMKELLNDKDLDAELRQVLLTVLDHYQEKPADKTEK